MRIGTYLDQIQVCTCNLLYFETLLQTCMGACACNSFPLLKGPDTVLMGLFLACFFICHVNYVKITANNMAMKYVENNMTQYNVTTCPIFWTPQ